MIRTDEIVVGIDGSASGWVALRWAAEEAALRDCLLHVVHCVEIPVVTPWRDGPTAPVPPITTGSRQDLLAEAVRRVRADHAALSLRTELVGDAPPYGLLHIARGAGLLVVGSRGMSLIAGLLVGSTALQVALHARCPVAVIPAASQHPNGPFPGRIVVGVDGSDHSTAALAFAFDEAERRTAGIVAVHAPTCDADERAFIGDITEMYTAEPSRKMLASIVDPWLSKHPNVPLQQEIIVDRPANALYEASAGAQLLVVGNRGHGGFVGLLLGSVSLSMVQRSECPVVIVRDGATTPL